MHLHPLPPNRGKGKYAVGGGHGCGQQVPNSSCTHFLPADESTSEEKIPQSFKRPETKG